MANGRANLYVCQSCMRTIRRTKAATSRLRYSTLLVDERKPAGLGTWSARKESSPDTGFDGSPANQSLSPSVLNTYTQTTAPTPSQLATARDYFERQTGEYLFTAAKFFEFPRDSATPEIAFLGRSNVGKSSLLNALFGLWKKKLAFTSKKAGRTRAMQVFGIGQDGRTPGGTRRLVKSGLSEKLMREKDQKVGEGVRLENWIAPGGLAVVDMPGYAHGSRGEWGAEITKYLSQRKQLRRAFVLIDAEHGLTKHDSQMLGLLREAGTPHQLVLMKVDKILGLKNGRFPSPSAMAEKLQQLEDRKRQLQKMTRMGTNGAVVSGDVLCATSTIKYAGQRPGIDALRWAILQAAGLEAGLKSRERKPFLSIPRTDWGNEELVPWDPR